MSCKNTSVVTKAITTVTFTMPAPYLENRQKQLHVHHRTDNFTLFSVGDDKEIKFDNA